MRAPGDPPYLLTVLSGPNAGAELPLSGTRRTLGGGATQDIRLDGLADEALLFAIERDRVALRPCAGVEITTRDGTVLTQGRTARLPLPAHLTIDGRVALHLCRLHQRRSFLARRLPALAAAVAVLCAMGFGFGTLLSTSGLATASIAPQSVAPLAPQPTHPRPAPCDRVCIADAAEAFHALVEEAGLVGVVATPDGDILRVSTQGIAQGDPRWAELREAYDATWAARVPLLVERTRPVPKAPFAVQSVWLGTPAEVTTRDGATYREGSTVPGGWTIESIRSGSIDLRSGATQIRIEF